MAFALISILAVIIINFIHSKFIGEVIGLRSNLILFILSISISYFSLIIFSNPPLDGPLVYSILNETARLSLVITAIKLFKVRFLPAAYYSVAAITWAVGVQSLLGMASAMGNGNTEFLWALSDTINYIVLSIVAGVAYLRLSSKKDILEIWILMIGFNFLVDRHRALLELESTYDFFVGTVLIVALGAGYVIVSERRRKIGSARPQEETLS
ncbi:hypothetical protein ACI5KX_07915 [Erythrobacter sp. GH1-10]|uniref:hypothetical protein n=1 Tax=Erythrobacter sp. GH1-10 TaxID=3349334 RepID=UPI003877FA0D